MDRIAILLITGLGVACIFAGYRLFCGLPALRGQAPGTSRTAVWLMNVVPGALLALLGTGLLAAEARSLTSHRPAIQRRQPPAEGVGWHRGKSGAPSRAA